MVKTGLHQESMEKSKNTLSKILADTYVLYTKTQNYHWNVEGNNFYSTHKMLEEHYESLAEAIDGIAEQIRFFGFKAPGTLKEFLELASLQEGDFKKSENEMIAELAHDHGTMVANIRKAITEIDETDFGTADVLNQRLIDHEKTAWMLRSHFPQG